MKMSTVEQNEQEDKKIIEYKYSNVVFTQILTVINNMIEFDIYTNIIKEVLEPKINEYNLNDEFKATINEVIQSRETNIITQEKI